MESADKLVQQAMKLGQWLGTKSAKSTASHESDQLSESFESEQPVHSAASKSAAISSSKLAQIQAASHPRPMSPTALVTARSTSSAAIDNRPWTTQDIGQNSIASLLNDPSSSISQKLEISKQALSAVPRTQLKHVRLKDFDRYLQDIAPVHQRYLECRNTATDGDPVLFDEETAKVVKESSILAPSENSQHPHKELNPLSPNTPVAAKPVVLGKRLSAANVLTGAIKTSITGRKVNAEDAIETIPAVFFESDFSLENPRVFELVTEYANVSSAVPSIGSDKGGSTTNSVLQEKLSHYLDTVEVHLVAEISRRSIEFFSALANIQSLHTETLRCLSHIREVRTSLSAVSEHQAKKGLEVVRQKKRRNNLNVLFNAVKMIKEVKKTQPMIQVLLNQGDYIGALDLITETNRLLKGSSPTLAFDRPDSPSRRDTSKSSTALTATTTTATTVRTINLNGVRGLVHLSGQLAEMSKMIASLMESDFLNIIVNNIQQQVNSATDPAQSLHRWALGILDSDTYNVENNSAGGGMNDVPGFVIEDVRREESLRSSLAPLVFGLVRTDRFGHALQAYRDRLMKIVKSVTKQFLPPAAAGEKEPSGANDSEGPLARRFKVMTFDDFFKMLSAVFISLLQIQRRVALFNEILSMILKDAEKHGIEIGVDKGLIESNKHGKSKPDEANQDRSMTAASITNPATAASTALTSMHYSQMKNEVSDILFAASDLAHVRCGKLLTLRSEQNAQLNSKDFFKLFQTAWRFLGTGEQICQRTCIGLRGTLMSQAKSFLNYFHMERMKQLTLLIDHEQWSQEEVPIDFQVMVSKIVKRNDSFPHTMLDATSTLDTDIDVSVPLEIKEDEKQKEKEEDQDMKPSRPNMLMYLVVDDKKYHVVPCALFFVKMLEEYLTTKEHVPSLTPDVLNRVVEISKFFNSRVCGVIVGGAAVQSSVLKTITAKHLALAGQSLGFVIALLPHIKNDIESQLPAKQKMLANDFDRVLTDYKNNQEQVFHRIIMIMEDRLAVHCAEISSTQWDTELPMATDGKANEPSNYMMQLLRETRKLHRILRKHLLPENVKTIFSQIFKMYEKKLEQELAKLELFTSAGKNRVLLDIQYYIRYLSSLEGVDGPGNHLEVVVNNIRIKDRREKRTLMSSKPPAPSTAPTAAASQVSRQATASNASGPAPAATESASQAAKRLGTTLSGTFGKLMSKTELPSFGMRAPDKPTSNTTNATTTTGSSSGGGGGGNSMLRTPMGGVTQTTTATGPTEAQYLASTVDTSTWSSNTNKPLPDIQSTPSLNASTTNNGSGKPSTTVNTQE